MLEIQTKHFPPDIVVLEITGRITIGRECKQLEWAVETQVREKKEKKIIFDLGGVTHMDSTGVGIIVMSAGVVKEAGGELRLAGANLDGAVARARGVSRPWGFVLNELGDRSSDLLTFAGLAVFAARQGDGPGMHWLSWHVLQVLLAALALFVWAIWLTANHRLMASVDAALVEQAKGVVTVIRNEFDPAHPLEVVGATTPPHERRLRTGSRTRGLRPDIPRRLRLRE